MTSAQTRVPPTVWALAAAVVIGIFPARRTPKWLRAIALLVLLASVGLGAWAIIGFRDRGTTVDPLNPAKATELVTEGANAISRNPMYVAMVGVLSALALWRGRAEGLLVVGVLLAVLQELQVKPEEAALTELFDQRFAEYCQRTPRWL